MFTRSLADCSESERYCISVNLPLIFFSSSHGKNTL
jgi:hypothetical protein